MLEIPESATIGEQAGKTLVGKTISKTINATSPHSFTWYNGDPKDYPDLLTGKQIISAEGHGAFIELHCDSDTHITISDGTNIKYYPAFEQLPQKHQLLIAFDDQSFVTFTVSMYGSIYAYKGMLDNPYYQKSVDMPSPLDDVFDEAYFEQIFKNVTKDISIKALLATEQRIPGLGNGVLQDILFNAGLSPRRKIKNISDLEKNDLFYCLKVTLASMTSKGGRDPYTIAQPVKSSF